jgi:hypothetical protein
MKMGHRSFKVDCALAACGLLSEREFAGLSEHMRRCRRCRRALERTMAVSGRLTGGVDSAPVAWPDSYTMLERFAARAASEGIEITVARRARGATAALGAAAMAILCCVVVVMAGLSGAGRAPRARMEAANEVAASGVARAESGSAKSLAASVAKSLSAREKVEMRSRRRGRQGKERPDGQQVQAIAATGLVATGLSVPSVFWADGDFEAQSPPGVLRSWKLSAIHSPLAAGSMAQTFATDDGATGCDGAPARLALRNFDAGRAPARRVFCYNPRIAMLTSLDLSHAGVTNAGMFFRAGTVAFRRPARAAQ